MKRLLLVASIAVVAIAAAIVIWRQRTELQELRRQRDVFEDLCHREGSYVRIVAQSLESSKSDGATNIMERFGSRHLLEACLPGEDFDFGPAQACWITKGNSSCALPILKAIAAAYERRWPFKDRTTD